MPLGKTPILNVDLMAEGDNNKHILFNNALVALEDAFNRALAVNLSTGNVTLTDTQITRFGVFICSGHSVTRTLGIPTTLTTSLFPTNRIFAVRNTGTGAITVSHGSGATVNVPAGSTGLLYANGTDIVSLGGVANNATIPVSEDGVTVTTAVSSLNFTGNAVAISNTGGAITITITAPQNLVDLADVPASLTGHGGKSLVVKNDLTGFEFVRTTMTNAEVKAAYEANANTNAFTDAEKTKLAGLESGRFKGTYLTEAALTAAHPSPEAGSYAYVDAGVGSSVLLYIWDGDDNDWVAGGGGGSTETSASIKTKYEANPDTNAFTDAEKTKLAGIEAGATADMTGAEIVSAINTQLGGTTWQGGGGGGGSSLAVEDEGTEVLPAATRMNFTGAGVSVADAGSGEVTVTIPGTVPVAINDQTASYTLVLADAGRYVRMSVAGANNLTVPPDASVAFPVGTVVQVRQVGAGKTTFVAGAGVTINTAETLALRKQGSTASLIKVDANVWDLTGDLELL